jgi:riboflavin kinase / FMN adenylyltransferase
MLLFKATVQPGRGRGAKIGFPTLNVRPLHRIDIEDGVYAARIIIDDVVEKGVMHIGTRPTFFDTFSYEVHCFSTTLQETPSEITIEIVQKLREVQSFFNASDLAKQIKADINQAKKIL